MMAPKIQTWLITDGWAQVTATAITMPAMPA
jgi:hypothetical protein